MIFLAFELDRLLNARRGDLQERRRCLNQLLVMGGTVPIFGKLLPDVTDPACARITASVESPAAAPAHPPCLKANSMNLRGLGDKDSLNADNSLVAVGLVNADGSSGPDAMRVQKDHDFPDDLLSGHASITRCLRLGPIPSSSVRRTLGVSAQ